MAGVRVLTGPPLEAPLYEINDKSTAALHAGLRAGDAISRLREDCRPLAELMDEAEKAAWLGHPDRETFILKVLSWPVRTIDLALEGLRWFDPAEPVPMKAAAVRGAAVVMARAGTLAAHGTNQHSEEVVTTTSSIGRGSVYQASRIKRDHPEIAAAVERGEYKSMRQAAIAAGIVKAPSGLAVLMAAWRKATEVEREEFLAAITRPVEMETS